MKLRLPFVDRLTFKSKLILLTLLASISSIVAIATLASYFIRQSLRQAAFDQLSLLQSENTQQIQGYFQSLRAHTVTLAADRTVVSAMVEFNKEFKQLDRKPIPTKWDEPLQDYYDSFFFPRLEALVDGEPRFDSYRPSGQAARYLQHHYLALNAEDEKNLLVDADDGSEYSRYHGEFHPLLNDIVQQFDYADLYLINHKNEEIVYSVNKLPDYGTNLETGPYQETRLAELVAAVRENSVRGTLAIADWDIYEPAVEPSLLIASPIYNGPYVVGILAIRLNSEPIERIMSDTAAAIPEEAADGNPDEVADRDADRTTQTDKSSLDSYLVGEGQRLISEPRAFRENPQRYIRGLRRQGTSDEILLTIEQFESPVLWQLMNTEPARAALGSETGRAVGQSDYRGVSVLSMYAPLNIEGLNWAVVSQIDMADAFAPAMWLELAMLVASILLITAFTFLAMIAATLTIKPLRRINEWADQVVDGNLDAELDMESEDEVGQLVDTLQIMVTSLSHQVATLNQKMEQNKVLLSNLVPPAIAKRLKRGETPIADRIKQVTLIYVSVVGIAELSQTTTAEQVTTLLTQLMEAFDEAAERHGIERQRTAGVEYVAICGLTVARLNHTKRTVDFALEMLQIINCPEFGQTYALGLRLAIHTGAVTAGVVGTKRFSYSVWGESIYLLTRLYMQATLNSVVLSQAAYERIADAYTCVSAGSVVIEKVGAIETWMLATREKLAVRQVDLVQESFAKLKPIASEAGKLFYTRLFEQRPDFKPLFESADMEAQQRKLIATLAVAVEGLRTPGKIVSTVQELGQRHQTYGVKAEDYADVGEALLWTLEQGLAQDFTPEVQQAWEVAISFISNIMIGAAAQIEKEEIGV